MLRPRGAGRPLARRELLAAAGATLAFPAIVRAAGQAGVALVIGNSKYQWEAQLPNVRRDAPDVARAFEALGLKTELVLDATRDTMNRSLDKLKAAAHGANFAAVYFAGHGAAWERQQYLVPVDADLSDPSTVKTLVKSTDTGPATKGASHRMLVFDNCRNNPADGWRQKAALQAAVINPEALRARMEHQPNTLVLFSTAPGRVALDGPPGQNSPFAAAFLRQMQRPSVDIQSISSKIRRDLLIATNGRQVMWDRNGYAEPFVLNGTGQGTVPPPGDPSRVIELPKAYAYAHEHGLPLPSGLVAFRPSVKSAGARMVGSWAYLNPSPFGKDPALLLVMSADGQTAEVIISVKGVYNGKVGKMEGGAVWRFVTGDVSSNRLEYVPRDQGARYTFDWSDANSGNFSSLNDSVVGSRGNIGASERFTRLDG
ncbi:MAG TPA: caspase family protein [Reyranella sp.]|jgi:hypothetical protein|nr:caspase family protein [Reyranella sp.]